MNKNLIIPSAEPFFLPGGETGCLLVHGFTGAPKEMRLMGNALNQKNITVLGIRLTGHATQPPDLIRTRWWDWLASVEDGFYLLKGYCKNIFIAGLSLGGILSLVAASRLPLAGVIAMSAPFELPRDWRLKFARPISAIIPWIPKGQSDIRDQEKARAHVDYPRYPTRSIAELNDLIKVLHWSLPLIKIPVLLIYSKTDKTVPFTHADQIAQLILPGLSEKVFLDQSAHVITEDINREIVFKASMDFIQKIGDQ